MAWKNNRLITKYKQFGGWRLLREYSRLGVLPTIVRQLLRIVSTGESSKAIYPAVSRKVDPFLLNKYGDLMRERLSLYKGMELQHLHRKTVWFCWLQGLEQAPDLVKACYRSQCMNLKDRTITVITADNYKDYIDIPEDLEQKYHAGIIPHAMFSDLIRLELLIKHGGTWIDSTVLCTGDRYPAKVLDGDLFLMQYRDNEGRLTGNSNWFITSMTNHPVLMTLRDVLYQYWRDYDCVLEYYIFHLFFEEMARYQPSEMKEMPRNNNYLTLQLGNRIGDDYDEKWMQELLSRCCFHKLNYRVGKKVVSKRNSFYHEIINRYLEH